MEGRIEDEWMMNSVCRWMGGQEGGWTDGWMGGQVGRWMNGIAYFILFEPQFDGFN